MILSSFIYNITQVDPQENEIRQSFYTALDQQADLVAEFKPYSGDVEPPFFFEQMWGPITDLAEFDRPGPTIKIYRLDL